jgi:hypothetical protein
VDVSVPNLLIDHLFMAFFRSKCNSYSYSNTNITTKQYANVLSNISTDCTAFRTTHNETHHAHPSTIHATHHHTNLFTKFSTIYNTNVSTKLFPNFQAFWTTIESTDCNPISSTF